MSCFYKFTIYEIIYLTNVTKSITDIGGKKSFHVELMKNIKQNHVTVLSIRYM